jgi:hypothetical protein
MKAWRLAAVYVATMFVAACAPMTVVLRSHHYRVVVPDGWRVEAMSGGEAAPTILRVPPADTDKSGDGLQLRIYAWTDMRTKGEPLAQAVGRVVGPDLDARGNAELCERRARFRLLGEDRPAAYLRARSGELLIVTTAKAAGSVVTVIGSIPNRYPLCGNVAAMESAIAALGTALAPGTDVDRVSSAPVVLETPGTPGRLTIIPPALPP